MNHVAKKGFTLIELMLAMSFISVLLVAITLTVIQISNIYNHGITLKDTNQTARAITNELQRTIAASAAFEVSGGSSRYIVQGDWGGRLCVGQYSYIWNYGKALNNNGPTSGNLNVYSANPNTKIRFVRAIDSSGAYCANPALAVKDSDAVELMNIGDHGLVLHSLKIISESTAVDQKSGARLYSISFRIGTNDQAALSADSTTCKGPGISGSDLAYCSVQDFTIVVRAGNEKK